jgi:hypothetical protein
MKLKSIAEEILDKVYPAQRHRIKFLYPEFYNEVVNKYGSGLVPSEYLYLTLHNLPSDHRVCQKSNLAKRFIKLDEGYGFCEKECACAKKSRIEKLKNYREKLSEADIISIKAKREKSCVEKFGVLNPFQSEDIKEKIKQTNLNNLGVAFPLQSEIVKEKIAKNNLEKYGVDHISKLSENRNKAKETLIERYGVNNPCKIDGHVNKVKNTNMSLYGVEYPCQLDEFKEKTKQTMIDTYGVENIKHLHIDTNSLNILQDKDKLYEFIQHINAPIAAARLGVDTKTIYKYLELHNIDKPFLKKSIVELDISQLLTENNLSHTIADRTVIPPKEIDIFLKEQNLAIEFNGMYWHSELAGNKPRSYHFQKWKQCGDRGITLLSIFENDYIKNKEFWHNKILYMCDKLIIPKIYARNCEIVIVDEGTKKMFLNQYHIQGNTNSKINIGLMNNDKLVCLMTFGHPRSNKNKVIDLNRFCNAAGFHVIGGASKLLTYFIKNYGRNYSEIISFSDNAYSDGKLYEVLGFTISKELGPDYKYVCRKDYLKTFHKSSFKKHLIQKKFNLNDDMIANHTEWELMQSCGYDRIWDCGKKKWTMEI